MFENFPADLKFLTGNLPMAHHFLRSALGVALRISLKIQFF
jgi:hypothetical protein